MKKKFYLLFTLIFVSFLFTTINVKADTAIITKRGGGFTYQEAGYSNGSASNDTASYIVDYAGRQMIGWCITPDYKNPDEGQVYDNVHEITNDKLIKILYYGQGGWYERYHNGDNIAEQVYKQRHGSANDGAQLIMTHAAAGKIYTSEVDTSSTSDWSYGGNETLKNDVNAYIDKISTLSVPAGVKAYYSVGGERDNGGHWQTIAYMTANVTIKINKKSSNEDKIKAYRNNYSLEGAVYTIYSDSGCSKSLNKTLKTNANGDTDDLTVEYGTYYIKETSAPKNFQTDETCHKCDVEPGKTCTVTSTDDPEFGNVTLRKTASDSSLVKDNVNYSLEGAMYDVYSDSNLTNKVGTLTTKKDGTSNTISNLAYGTYYAKETKAPKGFDIDSTVLQVTISSSNKTGTFRAQDGAKTGSITLNKRSSNPDFTNGRDNYSLEGAVYTVYSDEDLKNQVGTLTTDKDGNTNTLQGLAYGTYYIKETTAPKGYKLDDKNIYRAELTEDKPSYTVTATDELKKGKLSLVKKSDVKTDKSLKGAVYEVYKDKDLKDKVGTLTTDENGNTNVLELDPGVYYIKEITAPEGFNVSDEIIEATVVSDETTVATGVDSVVPENPKTGVSTYLVPTVLIVGGASIGLRLMKKKELFRQI